MNYIIFNGKDSRDVKGLLISELPPIVKPNLRVKETVIDGVDGSIIEELGYEPYDRAVSIALKVGADIDKVMDFFTGSGKIIFSNEPEKCYIGQIIKSIEYVRVLRYRTAKVVFRVQPFKYNRVEVTRQATSERKSMNITNEGNYLAKPIITLCGSGTIELSLNGNKIFQYTFPQGEYYVTIDSEKQDAYWQGTLKNRNMYGDFPIFNKGNNALAWDGSVYQISIEKYSRWL